jgi:hypothetical protein
MIRPGDISVATGICARNGCDIPLGSGRADKLFCSAHCRNLDYRSLHPRRGTPEEQLDLLARNNKYRSLSERYAAWRALNPSIYEHFKRFAVEALEAGQKIGAKAICERIRWEVRIRYRGDFKVNNSFPSRMARELIKEDPRFGDFFETRKLRTG